MKELSLSRRTRKATDVPYDAGPIFTPMARHARV